MRGRLVIAVGFTLIAAAVAMGQTTTKWVERTKADVRAGKGSGRARSRPPAAGRSLTSAWSASR